MVAPRSGTRNSSSAKSSAPIVGGGVGGIIAVISTQIKDPFFRNLVTVAAPLIAVAATSLNGAALFFIRNWWQNTTHSYHERRTTTYAKKILRAEDSSLEAKERAAKALANAQIVTLEFYESNLINVSQLGLKNAGKRNQVIADPSRHDDKA